MKAYARTKLKAVLVFNRFFQSQRIQKAQVAQSVEQRTENPRVGGSIPPLGTIHIPGSTKLLQLKNFHISRRMGMYFPRGNFLQLILG